MFFEKEQLAFRLYDSVYLSQGAASLTHGERHFDALSFRLRAEGEITTRTQKIPLSRGLVALVPHDTDYTRSVTYDELYAVHLSLLDYLPKKIEVFETSEPERYEILFSRLHKTVSERKSGALYRAASILNDIFASLREETAEKTAEGSVEREAPRSSLIAPSVHCLEERFCDPALTVAEVARQSHISEVYFRRLFKEAYGISPQKHLIRLRMRHASALMASGYYSLKEVALRSGYPDYTYFSSEFRRFFGVPPSEYHYNYTGKTELLLLE